MTTNRIDQHEQRLDTLGSMVDVLRQQLCDLEARSAENANVIAERLSALAILTDYKSGDMENRIAALESAVLIPTGCDPDAAELAKRNEAALDLIKTAYAAWLNDRIDPVHPNDVRHLASSIANALTGRAGNA